MSYNHYDEQGRYVGSSRESDDLGGVLAFLFIIGGIVFCLVWLWEQISNWQNHDGLAYYVAGYYNFALLGPLRVFGGIVGWLFR